MTGADILVRRLLEHGIRHVFGYPGGQMTPLYDALYREPAIRHVLARDEQAACFMADGYARASGKPAVCLAVCGPGVFNAATPLACAFTDSIPVLLLSGQVPSRGLGPRSGFYHENDQLGVCASFTKFQVRGQHVNSLVDDLDRALRAVVEKRPGPALMEVPLDVLRAETNQPPAALEEETVPMHGLPKIRQLAELIEHWKKPLLVAGGGVIAANAEVNLVRLAERLGAPVFTSFMGKCAIPADHPLAAGLPWREATSDLTDMGQFMSPLFAEADGVLAIGCRFTQAFTGSWALKLPESLAQIDVDAAELGRHYPVKLGVCADASEALYDLLAALPAKPRPPWFGALPERPPWRIPGWDLVGPLRRVLPRDAIVAADITRLSYILLAEFPVYQPGTFLHPAGFVAMGYGIPAAIGAKAAFPERTVVAVAGDGCFLMSGMELASAVQEKLPIVVVLINDGSLTLIKAIQERRYDSRFLGVDLANPDFGLMAKAFGVRHWLVQQDEHFENALRQAVALGQTTLVEVRL